MNQEILLKMAKDHLEEIRKLANYKKGPYVMREEMNKWFETMKAICDGDSFPVPAATTILMKNQVEFMELCFGFSMMMLGALDME